MRKKISAIILCSLVASLICWSCVRSDDTGQSACYKEQAFAFYDPFDPDYTLKGWIRKPKNIWTVHETFKKYGYKKLFSEDELRTSPCMIWGYINKPCSTLIDSLILTYPAFVTAPKYYAEFWRRRVLEQNDSTVYEVLKEVKTILLDNHQVAFDEAMTNDTIFQLLRIKIEKPQNEEEARRNFQYLAGIGCHLSAYNMLFEATGYDDLNLDRMELLKLLQTDSAACSATPIVVDDSK